MSTITNIETYTIFICDHKGCGLQFGLPDMFVARRREDQKTWYCPNGHSRWFPGETEEQRLAKRAARLERQLANYDEDLRAERASHQVTKNQRRAAKGQLTKTRRRIANGVCPCCNRSFVDLHRHMCGQHPDYVEVSK